MTARKVEKEEMKPFHKLVFEFVNNYLLPRSERHEATYLDLAVMEVYSRIDQSTSHL